VAADVKEYKLFKAKINIFLMQMFQKIEIKVFTILVFGLFCFTSFLKENTVALREPVAIKSLVF
jgi:hypothetical protein